MQVSVETADGLERTIRVEVPAEAIESEVRLRLRNVGRTARIKGFRPGKIPDKVLRQRYGGQVRQEVLNEYLQRSYTEAIEQENLRPAGGPSIEPEPLEDGEGLRYRATFEVYPEFEVTGIDSLKVEKPDIEIGETDVDGMFDNLRQQRAEWNAVEREAASGDRITIDFEGKLKGQPFEGGSGEKMPVVLGEGRLIDDLERQLFGLRAGDQKSLKVKFPKDYHNEELAGKKTVFDVSVSEVAVPELPELDEAFVKSFGIESGDIEEFRKDVTENMHRELAGRVQSELRRQVLEQLVDANAIDLPRVLIEEEATRMRNDALRRMGLSPEDADDAPGPEAFIEQATGRVHLGLVVGAIIREQDMEPDRDSVSSKIDEMCEPYQNPDEMRKLYLGNAQLLAQIESNVLEEKVVDWLLEQASVTPKPAKFSEFMELA